MNYQQKKTKVMNIKTLKKLIVLSCILFGLLVIVNAQSRVYMSMEYAQYVGKNKTIKINVRERVEKKFRPIAQLEIPIFIGTASGDSLLTTIMSDEAGIAYFLIADSVQLFINESGQSRIIANFKGDDQYKKAKKVIKVKNINFNASFNEDKTIDIKVEDITNDTTVTYPEKMNVSLFVERMFSDIKVAEVALKEGKGVIEYKADLPGDKDNNLLLKLVINDRKYGKPEFEESIQWGVAPPVVEEAKESGTTSYLLFILGSLVIVIILGIVLNRKVINVN